TIAGYYPGRVAHVTTDDDLCDHAVLCGSDRAIPAIKPETAPITLGASGAFVNACCGAKRVCGRRAGTRKVWGDTAPRPRAVASRGERGLDRPLLARELPLRSTTFEVQSTDCEEFTATTRKETLRSAGSCIWA